MLVRSNKPAAYGGFGDAKAFKKGVRDHMENYGAFVLAGLGITERQPVRVTSGINPLPGSVREKNLRILNRKKVKAINRVILNAALGVLLGKRLDMESPESKQLRKKVWEAFLRSNLPDDPLLAVYWWQGPLLALTLLDPVERTGANGSKFALRYEIIGEQEYPTKRNKKKAQSVDRPHKIALHYADGTRYREGSVFIGLYRDSVSRFLERVLEGKKPLPVRRQMTRRDQQQLDLHPKS